MEREVCFLAFFKGISEAAAELGVSPGAVQTTLHTHLDSIRPTILAIREMLKGTLSDLTLSDLADYLQVPQSLLDAVLNDQPYHCSDSDALASLREVPPETRPLELAAPPEPARSLEAARSVDLPRPAEPSRLLVMETLSPAVHCEALPRPAAEPRPAPAPQPAASSVASPVAPPLRSNAPPVNALRVPVSVVGANSALRPANIEQYLKRLREQYGEYTPNNGDIRNPDYSYSN